jgi:hypothetical protein
MIIRSPPLPFRGNPMSSLLKSFYPSAGTPADPGAAPGSTEIPMMIRYKGRFPASVPADFRRPRGPVPLQVVI